MPLRLAYTMCHCCFRGFPYKTKKTVIWDKWRNGSHEMVNRWTCTNCQSTVKLVEIFGRPVTAARYAVLAAL